MYCLNRKDTSTKLAGKKAGIRAYQLYIKMQMKDLNYLIGICMEIIGTYHRNWRGYAILELSVSHMRFDNLLP